MKEFRGLLFELIRLGVDDLFLGRDHDFSTEEWIAFKNRLTPDALKGVFQIAKRHDLAHVVAEVLDKLGVLSEETPEGKAFWACRQMAVYRYEQLFYESQRLYDAFEKAKLFYIPLKGAQLRTLYPEPWLRTSCDVDILVSEEDLETAVGACEDLEYTVATERTMTCPCFRLGKCIWNYILAFVKINAI